MDILALESQLAEIKEKINKAVELSEVFRNSQEINTSMALEADVLFPEAKVLDTYFSSDDIRRHKLVTEEISTGVMAAIAAGILAIVAVIVKMVKYLRGKNSQKGYAGTVEQVTQINRILSDHELRTVAHEVELLMRAVPAHALEDNSGSVTGVIVPVAGVFDGFKKSLTEPEVDFLTKGKRYTASKTTVGDFTKGNFPQFVNGIGSDLTKWSKEGLDKSAHVGKDPDVVKKFIAEQRAILEDIRSRYLAQAEAIAEMEKNCRDTPPMGRREDLHTFQEKPSALFPHLEKIWKDAEFDKLGELDKELISSLDRVQQEFTINARHVKAKNTTVDRSWPAEEAMGQLAYHSYHEVIKYITSLIRIGGFIRTTSETAYHATTKAFSYIIRMLNAISKMPNVDREHLTRCIDVIQRKRKELHDVAKID